MKIQVVLAFLIFATSANYLPAEDHRVHLGGQGSAALQGPKSRGDAMDLDPVKQLESVFPGTVKIKNRGHLVEFCPDGAGDGFVATSDFPAVSLKDFVYLYEYFFSDYALMDQLRARPEARSAAVRVLSKPEYVACKRDTDKEAARCVLTSLSHNRRVRLIFVRYDEGERHTVDMDISKELSREAPSSQ